MTVCQFSFSYGYAGRDREIDGQLLQQSVLRDAVPLRFVIEYLWVMFPRTARPCRTGENHDTGVNFLGIRGPDFPLSRNARGLLGGGAANFQPLFAESNIYYRR